MRRFLLLTACIALLGATAVRADEIQNPAGDLFDATHRTGAIPANALKFIRTLNAYTGYDKIDIRVNAYLTGATATWLSTEEGNWTALTGLYQPVASLYFYGATTTAIKNNTKNNSGGGQTAPQSWANFDSIVSGAVAWNTRTGTMPNYTVFGGSWMTTDNTLFLRPTDTSVGGLDDGIDETLVATLYVVHNGGVTFNGKFNAYNPSTFTNTNLAGSYTVDPINGPEPLTLVLLASGLIGLLAYAWRKRK